VLSTRGSGRGGNLAVAPVTARAGPGCIGNRARSDSISGLVITVASCVSDVTIHRPLLHGPATTRP
jgi:hypothetical protein